MNREIVITGLGLLLAAVILAEPAYAMHISEGILPLPWAGLWFAVSLPFVALGLKQLRARNQAEPHLKALMGLVGAAVFVISCMPIPVPTAGTCSHPCGTGLAALIVGPTLSVVLASIALTLQALFLAHGGLTTLGANIFSMGVVGSFAGYGAFWLARRLGAGILVAAFAAGLVSDWATYAATAFTLTGALHGQTQFNSMYLAVLAAFVPTQLPLGILEGFMTAGAYRFLSTRRPEFLTGSEMRVAGSGLRVASSGLRVEADPETAKRAI
ncbi:MAG: energy-coupling factor ABC transporter permease [Deltaproteobacteria bacterium]|nr:energy-coupling factor ABC transporter permease [Deltaproteobacteria bacterium]